MEDHQNCDAELPAQPPDEPQNLQLIADVQIIGYISPGAVWAHYKKGAKIANAVFREIYRPCCEAVHAITNKEAFL